MWDTKKSISSFYTPTIVAKEKSRAYKTKNKKNKNRVKHDRPKKGN